MGHFMDLFTSVTLILFDCNPIGNTKVLKSSKKLITRVLGMKKNKEKQTYIVRYHNRYIITMHRLRLSNDTA